MKSIFSRKLEQSDNTVSWFRLKTCRCWSQMLKGCPRWWHWKVIAWWQLSALMNSSFAGILCAHRASPWRSYLIPDFSHLLSDSHLSLRDHLAQSHALHVVCIATLEPIGNRAMWPWFTTSNVQSQDESLFLEIDLLGYIITAMKGD